MLFADSVKISKQYKLGIIAGEDLSIFSINSIDSAIIALSNNIKELAIKRQKSSSILKIT